MIRLRHLMGDTAIYGLVSAARSMVGLVLVPIYTRVFPAPADYGRIDTLITFISILTLILTLGMDTSVALYFYDNQDEHDRATLLTTAILARVGLTAAAALVMTLLAPAISWHLFDLDLANAIRLAAWTAPTNALVGFLVEILRLARRTWQYTVVAVANLILGLLLSILFVGALGWGIEGALLGPLAGNLIMLPVGLFLTRDLFTPRFSGAWLRRLLRVGLPMVPSAFGGWIMAYANRYFLLFFYSATSVGLLSVGGKASAPLVLFTTAFRTAWGPFAFSLQNQENARQVYAKALTYFCVVSGAMAVLVGLFAREGLLIVTTEQYIPGYVVSGLICFQLIADACYYIVSIGLMLTKQTKKLALSLPIAATCCIIFSVVLVPPLDFFGAALATTLSYVASMLAAYLLSQRVYPIPYEVGKVARLAALAVGVWLLGLLVLTGQTWLDIGLKLVLFGAFLAGLILLRIVRIEELALLVRMVRGRLAGLYKRAA